MENEQAANVETASLTFEEKSLADDRRCSLGVN